MIEELINKEVIIFLKNSFKGKGTILEINRDEGFILLSDKVCYKKRMIAIDQIAEIELLKEEEDE